MSYFGYGVNPPSLIDPESIVNIFSSTVLNAEAFERTFIVRGTSDITMTLMPLLPGAKAHRFMIVNDMGSNEVTVIAQGNDIIRYQALSVNSLSLSPGEVVEIENNVTRWQVVSNVGSIPTGTVQAFAGSTAPIGYLLCNGAAVSRTTYSKLFSVIGTTYGAGNGTTTFNVPDLRGEFIRGLDAGRGVDIGRTLGSSQGDLFRSHTHSGSTTADGGHTHTGSTSVAGAHQHGGVAVPGRQLIDGDDVPFREAVSGSTDVAGNHSHSLTINAAGSHTHSLSINSTGGVETRPRNVAMNFIIKY